MVGRLARDAGVVRAGALMWKRKRFAWLLVAVPVAAVAADPPAAQKNRDAALKIIDRIAKETKKAAPQPAPAKVAVPPVVFKGGVFLNQPEAGKASEPTSLPTDPGVRRRLDEIGRLFDEGRLLPALSILQGVLDESDESYLPASEGESQSARRRAETMVEKKGADAIAAYRVQFGKQAEALLRQAKGPTDWGVVLKRFFLTEAGREAANRLASYQLDRGRAALALVYLDRLFESPAHRDQVGPTVRAKRAVALALVGRIDDSRRTLEALGEEKLTLGGRPLAASELLRSLPQSAADRRDTVGGWMMRGGAPTRDALGIGGAPLLSADWSAPLAPGGSASMVATMIRDVLRQNSAQRRPTILANEPIVVGDVACLRDFTGLAAIELATGKERWRVLDSSGLLSPSRRPGQHWPPNTVIGNQATYFSNTVHGALSSDGHRVYLIEHNVLAWGPYPARVINNRPNPELENRRRNQLAARELSNGELAWSIGGKVGEKEKGAEGETFFFGPPLPWEGKLYSLVETKGELRLLTIDPRDGAILSSLLLVTLQRRVDADPIRRTEAIHLAADQGILVCPTNQFRLLGVDPLTRSVLWNYAYADDSLTASMPAEHYMVIPPKWYVGEMPIIHEGRVVVAPSTGRSVHCVDLSTGRRHWKIDREEAYDVAGVADGKALLLAGDHVRAVRLDDGRKQWRTKIPLPAGRAIVVNDRLLVPTVDGRVLSLSVADGQVKEEVRSRQEEPIGTLLASAGRIVATGPMGIRAYPLLSDARSQAEALLAANPKDPFGLFRRAQLRLTTGEWFAAIEDLLAALDAPDSSARAPARDLLFSIAAREALADPANVGPLVERVTGLAVEPGEKGVALRLKAEHALATRQFKTALASVEAHDNLSSLATLPVDPSGVTRASATWTRAFMGRLVESAKGSDGEAVVDVLEERLRGLIDRKDVMGLDRFASSLASVDMGQRAALALGQILRAKERLGEAEHWLGRSATSRDPVLAAESLASLASVSEKAQRPGDAAYYRRRLAERYPEVKLANGRTGRDEMARATEPVAPDDWKFDEVVVRSTPNIPRDIGRRFLFPTQSEPPFFDDRLVAFDQRGGPQKFEVLDRATGATQWVVTIQRNMGYMPLLKFDHVGHLIVFAAGDTLHAVSALDKKLIWSHPLTEAAAGDGPGIRAPQVVYYGGAGGLTPGVAYVGAAFVVARTPTAVEVLDAWTGRMLWSRRDVDPDMFVMGDDDYLLIVARDGKFQGYRAIDGTFLRAGDMGVMLRYRQDIPAHDIGKRKPATGRRLLLVRQTRDRQVARLWDPWTGDDRWERGFPAMTRFFLGDDGELIAVESSGNVTVVDSRDGKLILRESFPEIAGNFNARVSLFRDHRRRYLGVDLARPAGPFFAFPQHAVATRTVNGPLRAFDIKTNKLLWSTTLSGRSVITSGTEELPVLVCFGVRTHLQGGVNRPISSIELIDKRAGKSLYAKDNEEFMQLTELFHNGVERWIELRTLSRKMRIDFLTADESKRFKKEIEDGKRPPPRPGRVFEGLRPRVIRPAGEEQ